MDRASATPDAALMPLLHIASAANREAPEAQAATIRGLCAAGADPNALDASGVAPLHRAVRTRGSTGSPSAIERQRRIIERLLGRVAVVGDVDAKGRTAADVARAEWIGEVLAERG